MLDKVNCSTPGNSRCKNEDQMNSIVNTSWARAKSGLENILCSDLNWRIWEYAEVYSRIFCKCSDWATYSDLIFCAFFGELGQRPMLWFLGENILICSHVLISRRKCSNSLQNMPIPWLAHEICLSSISLMLVSTNELHEHHDSIASSSSKID